MPLYTDDQLLYMSFVKWFSFGEILSNRQRKAYLTWHYMIVSGHQDVRQEHVFFTEVDATLQEMGAYLQYNCQRQLKCMLLYPLT